MKKHHGRDASSVGTDSSLHECTKAELGFSAAEPLWQMLSSLGDGVIGTDSQGCVTFLNGEAERLIGLANDVAKGQPLKAVFQLINEHTRQSAEDPVAKVLRLGTVVRLADHAVLVSRDGREIPIDHSGAPIRHSDGTVHGVVLVFRDERGLARLAAIVESSEDAILPKILMALFKPGI